MKVEKFKVLLYLKKSGLDKNGKAPIMDNPEHNNHTYTFSFLPDHAAALPKEFY